jgi:aerotolerance regulator-like protein
VTLAAPGFLAAAFAVAAAVTALHLLVLRPPPASRLPTARFVPPAPSLVRRRETWPQDRWLLALRVATILLAGLAFAGPALGARRVPSARIIAMDLSAPSARDSATRYLRASDILIVFDTGARVLPADSLNSIGQVHRVSSLSSALVAARRVAAHLSADSIMLVVISPFTESELDAATSAIRAQWPAAIRMVRRPVGAGPTRRGALVGAGRRG